MSLVIQTDPVPLRTDDRGVVRVAGTRVTLDTIVAAFQQGSSPEVIHDQYPSVSLPDVYAVVGYYLRHREQVDAYLAQRSAEREAIRRDNESRFPTVEGRRRILKRRNSRERLRAI